MAPFGVDVEGVTRQNLWANAATRTSNGVTYKENSNGSVTLSGTESTNNGVGTFFVSKNIYTIKPNTTYVLSINQELSFDGGTYPPRFRLELCRADGTTISTGNYPTTDGTVITTSADVAFAKCVLVVYDGCTVSGTYRVMLNEGSEAEPWCPPGLNSVDGLEVWQAGGNLFDIPERTAGGVTVSRGSDGSYVVSGTSTAATFKSSRSIVLPHGKVTVTLDKGMQSGTCFSMYQYDALGNTIAYKDFQSAGTVEVDILDACNRCMIGFYAGNGVAVSGEYRIMMSLAGEIEWIAPSEAHTTSIPLLGNRLRSLPDGTRDSLSVDSAGNVVMEKRVGIVSGASSGWSANPNFTGAKHGYSLVVADSAVYDDAESASPMCNVLSIHQVANTEMRDHSIKHTTTSTMIARHDTCADLASWKSWLSSSAFEMLYALETPQIVPLGHVDLPALPADGAVMWVVAEDAYGNSFTLEPGSSFQWYGENAEALGEYATKAQLRVEADTIRSEVEETYQSKDGMSDYATVSSVEQTASEIESNVAATYQTKAGMSAYATNSSVTQTANSIKQEVAAEYTTKEDAQATYATKTSLQQTEDSILSSVESEYQSKDGMSSYATKSYVDQQDNSIKSTVSSVQTTANNALSKASTVEQTAEGLEVTLTSTTTTANNALSKANSAASAASTAQSTASSAATAAAAANKVFYANSTTAAATKAKTATVSGSGFALVVGVTVSVRFQYANTANSPTLNVNSTGAKPIVSNGTATPTANLTWNAAWATVTFVYDGSQWRISGDNSIVKANSAQSTANTANSTANAAKTAAANAQTAAANAAKTATNYLKFDSAGLCVGNHTGTLGYNTLIKSTGVDIRNGSTVLASFGASTINLGANSNTASIGFANGSGAVRGYSDSYYGRTIDIVRGNRSYIRLGDTHLACDIGAGGDGYFAFDAHTEGPVAYLSGTVSTGATSEESCNVPMSRLIDLLKDMAHPVGSVMILKGSMSPTPNDLGFPGTWSVCAIGMRVVGTGLGFAGSQVHVNSDWSMGVEPYDGGWDEVFWLDLFPNSGNSTRTASTVWLRTA